VKRVLVAFGTRPEAIKLAPVIFALREIPDLEVVILLTGQHREQVDSALRVFEIETDDDLDLMVPRQDLPELSARVIAASAQALRIRRPDYVVVHGDTMSAFCVALSAFLERVPVAHVEAGLRSGRIGEPFPEEASRRMTDVLSDLDLAPTPLAARNLLAEGKDAVRVLVTGQTVVDAVRLAAGRSVIPERLRDRRLVTITMHRRENWPILGALASSLGRVARDHPGVVFVYPMHLNPVVREAVVPQLRDIPNVHLREPFDYGDMAALMAASELIVTDSGGILEEGVSLGVRVLVLRNVTERPEGIDAGLAELLGTDPDTVQRVVSDRLRQGPEPRLVVPESPYGDGRAATRVARGIAWQLRLCERPEEWHPTPFQVSDIKGFEP
jgi:UDP-N-acetylglucosamine 2-epimerase (non-hydrolysing)